MSQRDADANNKRELQGLHRIVLPLGLAGVLGLNLTGVVGCEERPKNEREALFFKYQEYLVPPYGETRNYVLRDKSKVKVSRKDHALEIEVDESIRFVSDSPFSYKKIESLLKKNTLRIRYIDKEKVTSLVNAAEKM